MKKVSKKTKEKITKDMTFAQLLEKYPESINILFEAGLHCIGCHMSAYETIEQGCKVHGMSKKDIDELLRRLNKQIDSQEKKFKDEVEIDGKKISIKISKSIKEEFLEDLKEKISQVLSEKTNFLSKALKNSKKNNFEIIYINIIENPKEYLPKEEILKKLKIKPEKLISDGSVFINEKIAVRWVLVTK